MSSNLGCLGLSVQDEQELGALIQAAMHGATLLARLPHSEVWRWQDPSGVRLVCEIDPDGGLLNLMPSYGGHPGATVANCVTYTYGLGRADIVDASGNVVTSAVFALEQQRLLERLQTPYSSQASFVALGVEVSLHTDEDAFSTSDDSLLTPGDPGEPPEGHLERGMMWPPRIASRSFTSFGTEVLPEQADAHGRLSGIVLGAERRTVGLSGQDFIVVRVRSAGFDLDLCMATSEHETVPAAGSVVAGTVYLAASIDGLNPPSTNEVGVAVLTSAQRKRRRWLSRS
jgi:hypothetical protein